MGCFQRNTNFKGVINTAMHNAVLMAKNVSYTYLLKIFYLQSLLSLGCNKKVLFKLRIDRKIRENIP